MTHTGLRFAATGGEPASRGPPTAGRRVSHAITMRMNQMLNSEGFAVRREHRNRGSSSETHGEVFRLTRRAAMSVVLLLSLGLWAALWTAVASLASAVFG